MTRDETIDKICDFLDRIGIDYSFGPAGDDSFLPGLRIDAGKVVIDREVVPYPGDILHEAGHLALVPGEERPTLDQESLAKRESGQGEEIACQLWTFLVCREIGLPPQVVFHEGGYRGGSDWFIENYENGIYMGLPLLTWMGVTEPELVDGKPVVKQWLRS